MDTNGPQIHDMGPNWTGTLRGTQLGTPNGTPKGTNPGFGPFWVPIWVSAGDLFLPFWGPFCQHPDQATDNGKTRSKHPEHHVESQ